MSSDISIDPPAIDPIEQLLIDFSRRHNLSIETLRREHKQLLIDLARVAESPAPFRPEYILAATRNFLNSLAAEINSGKLVLCATKARNGYLRAAERKEFKTRKQLTGPRKLRSKKDRSRAEAWLKEKRRAG